LSVILAKKLIILKSKHRDVLGHLDTKLKEAIFNFYEKLYYEDHLGRPFLEGICHDSIFVAEACDLLKEFLEEEVWKAINDLGKEQALGPDGFNISFFQHCWSIVKGKLWVYFRSFTQKVFLRKA